MAWELSPPCDIVEEVLGFISGMVDGGREHEGREGAEFCHDCQRKTTLEVFIRWA